MPQQYGSNQQIEKLSHVSGNSTGGHRIGALSNLPFAWFPGESSPRPSRPKRNGPHIPVAQARGFTGRVDTELLDRYRWGRPAGDNAKTRDGCAVSDVA